MWEVIPNSATRTSPFEQVISSISWPQDLSCLTVSKRFSSNVPGCAHCGSSEIQLILEGSEFEFVKEASSLLLLTAILTNRSCSHRRVAYCIELLTYAELDRSGPASNLGVFELFKPLRSLKAIRFESASLKKLV